MGKTRDDSRAVTKGSHRDAEYARQAPMGPNDSGILPAVTSGITDPVTYQIDTAESVNHVSAQLRSDTISKLKAGVIVPHTSFLKTNALSHATPYMQAIPSIVPVSSNSSSDGSTPHTYPFVRCVPLAVNRYSSPSITATVAISSTAAARNDNQSSSQPLEELQSVAMAVPASPSGCSRSNFSRVQSAAQNFSPSRLRSSSYLPSHRRLIAAPNDGDGDENLASEVAWRSSPEFSSDQIAVALPAMTRALRIKHRRGCGRSNTMRREAVTVSPTLEPDRSISPESPSSVNLRPDFRHISGESMKFSLFPVEYGSRQADSRTLTYPILFRHPEIMVHGRLDPMTSLVSEMGDNRRKEFLPSYRFHTLTSSPMMAPSGSVLGSPRNERASVADVPHVIDWHGNNAAQRSDFLEAEFGQATDRSMIARLATAWERDSESDYERLIGNPERHHLAVGVVGTRALGVKPKGSLSRSKIVKPKGLEPEISIPLRPSLFLRSSTPSNKQGDKLNTGEKPVSREDDDEMSRNRRESLMDKVCPTSKADDEVEEGAAAKAPTRNNGSTDGFQFCRSLDSAPSCDPSVVFVSTGGRETSSHSLLAIPMASATNAYSSNGSMLPPSSPSAVVPSGYSWSKGSSNRDRDVASTNEDSGGAMTHGLSPPSTGASKSQDFTAISVSPAGLTRRASEDAMRSRRPSTYARTRHELTKKQAVAALRERTLEQSAPGDGIGDAENRSTSFATSLSAVGTTFENGQRRRRRWSDSGEQRLVSCVELSHGRNVRKRSKWSIREQGVPTLRFGELPMAIDSRSPVVDAAVSRRQVETRKIAHPIKGMDRTEYHPLHRRSSRNETEDSFGDSSDEENEEGRVFLSPRSMPVFPHAAVFSQRSWSMSTRNSDRPRRKGYASPFDADGDDEDESFDRFHRMSTAARTPLRLEGKADGTWKFAPTQWISRATFGPFSSRTRNKTSKRTIIFVDDDGEPGSIPSEQCDLQTSPKGGIDQLRNSSSISSVFIRAIQNPEHPTLWRRANEVVGSVADFGRSCFRKCGSSSQMTATENDADLPRHLHREIIRALRDETGPYRPFSRPVPLAALLQCTREYWIRNPEF